MPVRSPRAAPLAALAALLLAAPAQAKPPKRPIAVAAKPVSGTIAGFECAVRCYLSIETADGASVSAPCHARECAPWVDAQEMPKAMVGREVKATLGAGPQFDAAGVGLGRMDAFTKLEFAR
jgi:hypothetical protein